MIMMSLVDTMTEPMHDSQPVLPPTSFFARCVAVRACII